jgi:hypothetical protein
MKGQLFIYFVLYISISCTFAYRGQLVNDSTLEMDPDTWRNFTEIITSKGTIYQFINHAMVYESFHFMGNFEINIEFSNCVRLPVRVS